MSIKNAAPTFIPLGTKDLSARSVTPEELTVPQHMPKFYIFAQKGTTNIINTSDIVLTSMYGEDTFDSTKEYFTHATDLFQRLSGIGNGCMVQRVVPDDAKKASMCIYLDIVSDDVPNYERNSDGSIAYDQVNQPIVNATTPTIPGYRVKFIKEYYTAAPANYGVLTQKAGTMVNADDVVSTMYPMFEMSAAYAGNYYNNIGITIAPLTYRDITSATIAKLGAMPFNVGLVVKPTGSTTPTAFTSLTGSTKEHFCLKPGVVDPILKTKLDLDNVIVSNWFNEDTSNLKKIQYNEYDNIFMYNDNIDTVLGLFATTEFGLLNNTMTTWHDNVMATNTSWFDTTSNKYMLNPFTCKSLDGVPYLSIVSDTTTPVSIGVNASVVTFTTNTPVYLSGGTDGTLTNEEFEACVVAKIENYADGDTVECSMALSTESIFWDTGFTLATKLKLANVLAVRKDMVLGLATYDSTMGNTTYTISQEIAIGNTLRNILSLYPESIYYGTSVARGVVVMGSGLVDNTRRVPGTFELAHKAGKMMGSSDGRWKAEYLFDSRPNSVVTELTDIYPKFIPESIKATMWDTGLIWMDVKDRKTYYFPALQTIYDDDTSVLNSFFTIMAVCTVTKAAFHAWSFFTGAVRYTNLQFVDVVEAKLTELLKDKFIDSVIEVVPKCVITATDEQRGFSWHMTNKLYANNSKTVGVYNTETYRMESLTQQN